MTKATKYPQVTPYGAKYKKPVGPKKIAMRFARERLRDFGQATASFRELPDYLIIGTKRGGTTSLARWLVKHPEVRPLFPARETRKGAYYFDVNYAKGRTWYQSHFPTRLAHSLRSKKAGKRLLLGDATPYYLHHPHAAQRASRLVPNAKIIVLVRNPVERAFSHWIERTRQKIETLSFEEAIAAETERIADEEAKMLADPSYVSFSHQHYSYVDQGRYSRGLERWLQHYPKKQLLILRSEDLYKHSEATYHKVLKFLDLSPHTLEEFSAWNKKKKPEMPEATKAHLAEQLAPEITRLEKMLGTKMSWQ